MNKLFANSTRLGRMVCLLAVAIGVAACERSTFHVSKQLGETQVLLSSAELSKTFERPGTYERVNGRFLPNSVVCAEPSPDVVKSVQSSFGASISAAKTGTGSAAAAASRAIAESATQLGERLATIQLLRDGLYRACEAYANGAFSEVTYAVLLSGYDDTVVSLLTAELAAGAFGRSGAALAGTAAAEAASDAALKEALSERIETERELEQSREEKRDFQTSLKKNTSRSNELESSLVTKRKESSELDTTLQEAETREGDAQAELDDAVASNAASSDVRKLTRDRDESRKEVDSLEEELEKKNKEVEKLSDELEETNKEVESLSEKLKESEKNVEDRKKELDIKLRAETKAVANATAVAIGGITPGKQNPEIARVLASMQRKFLENINSDALVVACVTALARVNGMEQSALAKECAGPDGLLKTVVRSQSALLASVKKRSIFDRDQKALEEAVKQIDLINKSLNHLRKHIKPSTN